MCIAIDQHTMIADEALEKGEQRNNRGTDIDIECSIRASIEAAFDKLNTPVFIFGEEGGISGSTDADDLYFIDPQDGSGPRGEGFPHYGMSIGVYRKTGEPLVGLYRLPELSETFLAKEGKRAWLNGSRLSMPKANLSEDSYLIVSSDTHKHRDVHNWRGKIRAYGVSGLHLCLLAAGRGNLHAVYLTRYKYHDVAAGAQILVGAGGVMINLDEGNREFKLEELASTDPEKLEAYGPRLLACHPDNADEILSQLHGTKNRRSSKVAMQLNWLEYRGDSVLFDNLGNSFVRLNDSGDFLKIHCDVENDSELIFYKALAIGMRDLGLDSLPNAYQLCPLPLMSYHVTLFDGFNVGNKDAVSDSAGVQQFLDGLPSSIREKSEFTTTLRDFQWLREYEEITFEFDRLSVFGSSVLVARLKPSEEAKPLLAEIEARRIKMIELLEPIGDVKFGKTYSPHVSLGYFAETIDKNVIPLGTWNRIFGKLTDGKTLTFKTASLYGFTDMATFFKKSNGHK